MITYRVCVRHPAAFGLPEAWEQLPRDYETASSAVEYLKQINAVAGQGGSVVRFDDDAGPGTRVHFEKPRLSDEAAEAKAAVQEMTAAR